MLGNRYPSHNKKYLKKPPIQYPFHTSSKSTHQTLKNNDQIVLTRNQSMGLLTTIKQMGPIIDSLIDKTQAIIPRTNKSLEKIVDIVRKKQRVMEDLSRENRVKSEKYNILKSFVEMEISSLKSDLLSKKQQQNQKNIACASYSNSNTNINLHIDNDHATQEFKSISIQVSCLKLQLEKEKTHNSELSNHINFLQNSLETKIKEIQDMRVKLMEHKQVSPNCDDTLKFQIQLNQIQDQAITSRRQFSELHSLRFERDNLLRANRQCNKQLDFAVMACKEATKGLHFLQQQNRKKDIIIQSFKQNSKRNQNQRVKTLQLENQKLKNQLSTYYTELHHLRQSINGMISKTLSPSEKNIQNSIKFRESGSLNFQISSDSYNSNNQVSPQFRIINSRLDAVSNLSRQEPLISKGIQYTPIIRQQQLSFSDYGDISASQRSKQKQKKLIPLLDLHSGLSKFNKIKRVVNRSPL